MDKRKWLWKRRHSERSPGETDSSGSISSHSERYSDEQEDVKDSPYQSTASPEVTSKAVVSDDEVTDSVKNLTEKLSAALVNVSMKEDLVNQHAKVAEEAVAGWEQAENEATILKQQLDAAVQQNLALEVRASHLDCALKECVRQLRQAKDEQEEKIHAAVAQKNGELEKVKAELEDQLLQLESNIQATIAHPTSIDHILQKIEFLEKENSVLQLELLSRDEELELKTIDHRTSVSPDILQKMDFLEKENSVLKFELLSRNEELELKTVERDLSTQAAEMASKQQLESIKKVTRLEAECRRLQTIVRKSSAQSDNRSIASSICSETVTDAQPESVDHFINGVDTGARKLSKSEPDEFGRSRSDSWSSALIAEFAQFNNAKRMEKGHQVSSVEIDMMEDFLEMERLVALPEPCDENPSAESETSACKSSHEESSLKAELETMTSRLAELEERLVTIEKERTELECGLSDSRDSLQASEEQLAEAVVQLDVLQRELTLANNTKELLKYQLTGMEIEARTLKSVVDNLEIKVQKEKALSTELAAKCEELEKELLRKSQEIELQQTANGNGDLKIKQEDLVEAADKLSECQQTIASLGRQLKSLATLEDFLIDTSNLPGFSGNRHLVPVTSAEMKSQTNKALAFKTQSDLSRTPGTSSSLSRNGNEGESPSSSSSSTSSTGIVTSAKSRNGFVRLFSRSKNGIQIESQDS